MTKSEKSELRVSAVVPAYNAEKYIARSIDSILNQTLRPGEIIIVDDGSTDGTAEIIKSYGDKVRYIHQKNAGASVARNTGVNAATGEWIAFLDCDDEWLEDHIQQQVELIERNPGIFWAGANYYSCFCKDGHRRDIHDKGNGSKLLASEEVYDNFFQAYNAAAYGWTGTLVIRKDSIVEAGMFTPSLPMGNDVDMWFRIAYKWPRFGYNSKPQAVYHSHVEESITKKQRNPELLCNLIAKHLELSKTQGAYDRFKPCAVHIVKYWIFQYLFDDRAPSVNGIVKRFSGILPLDYKIAIRFLTICPALTRKLKPVINKIFGRLGYKR